MCFLQLRGNIGSLDAGKWFFRGAGSTPSTPLRDRSQTEVNGCSHEQLSDALCCGGWDWAELRGEWREKKPPRKQATHAGGTEKVVKYENKFKLSSGQDHQEIQKERAIQSMTSLLCNSLQTFSSDGAFAQLHLCDSCCYIADSDFTPSPRHLCLIHALGFKVLTATNIVATETELLVCGNN